MDLDAKRFLETIGTHIRQRREAQGLTQAQLGERCELDRTFIGSVERGERNVSVLNLRKIARSLRIPLIDLFVDPSAPPSDETALSSE